MPAFCLKIVFCLFCVAIPRISRSCSSFQFMLALNNVFICSRSFPCVPGGDSLWSWPSLVKDSLIAVCTLSLPSSFSSITFVSVTFWVLLFLLVISFFPCGHACPGKIKCDRKCSLLLGLSGWFITCANPDCANNAMWSCGNFFWPFATNNDDVIGLWWLPCRALYPTLHSALPWNGFSDPIKSDQKCGDELVEATMHVTRGSNFKSVIGICSILPRADRLTLDARSVGESTGQLQVNKGKEEFTGWECWHTAHCCCCSKTETLPFRKGRQKDHFREGNEDVRSIRKDACQTDYGMNLSRTAKFKRGKKEDSSSTSGEWMALNWTPKHILPFKLTNCVAMRKKESFAGTKRTAWPWNSHRNGSSQLSSAIVSTSLIADITYKPLSFHRQETEGEENKHQIRR